MEESLNQRLYNSIGFLYAMRNFADKRNDKQIEIDKDNLTLLLQLLMDCKECINE